MNRFPWLLISLLSPVLVAPLTAAPALAGYGPGLEDRQELALPDLFGERSFGFLEKVLPEKRLQRALEERMPVAYALDPQEAQRQREYPPDPDTDIPREEYAVLPDPQNGRELVARSVAQERAPRTALVDSQSARYLSAWHAPVAERWRVLWRR